MICWVLSVVFNGSGVFRFVWIDWPVTCFPACQWPVLGSWRGGKQPSRRSSGGWRSCGGGGSNFINIKIVIKESQHSVVVRGAWREALDFAALVGKAWLEFVILITSLYFLTFTFCSFSFLFVLSSVLDKDPSGLKVLALNKFKSRRCLCFAVEN